MRAVWEMLVSGGPVMVPLALCSLGVLAIVLEKAWNLRRSLVVPEEIQETLLGMLEGGRVEEVRGYCAAHPMALTNLVGSALVVLPYGLDEVRQSVEGRGRREVAALERYLPLLGTLGVISPLLGLMGTVLGMMEIFSVISEMGVGQAEALSSGIAQALITTVTGLAIAIPALLFYNVFHTRAGMLVLEMEAFALRVVRLLGAGGEAASSGAAKGDGPERAREGDA